jgi:hypothetical protein
MVELDRCLDHASLQSRHAYLRRECAQARLDARSGDGSVELVAVLGIHTITEGVPVLPHEAQRASKT